ncbi:GNAT family N-acetyltransferase [Kitasatospora sp. DSM 101779]|uniref:GNAT family N-acetyltransferase n=1 Tax=Kitasatospora sp. DSM 101779 TaxID=2853165 RepID=UPI0021D981B4|nr:GNAT family N-acetyltransferase [Kitasatospora sp. DSM 101779]MCU7825019.1 GNAT family N-acetyltransferase [Kitasatospora sp. DSM 101779]
MTLEIAPGADRDTWLPAHLQRLVDRYLAAGLSAAAAGRLAEQQREQAGTWTVADIREDGRTVGSVAVAVADREGTPVGRIGEVWTVPGYERLRPAALDWAERWCAERGGNRVEVRVTGTDPLFDRYTVRGQNRVKELSAASAEQGSVTARPMTAEEYPAWRAQQEDAYVFDMLRSGSHTEQEARAKSAADFARMLPEDLATPGHALLVLEAEGRTVGTGWLHHGFLPGVTFGCSLDVLPEERGRGFGRAAMAAGELAALAAGDGMLMLNVFGGNTVAMQLYSTAGYRVLEEGRSRDVSGGAGA